MKFKRRFIWRTFGVGFLAISALSMRLAASDPATATKTPRLSDKTLGREIHNAIVADPTLPYCAHIVSVRVHDGVVMLKGRVQTKVQKKALLEKAATLAGEENVVADIQFFNERSIQ